MTLQQEQPPVHPPGRASASSPVSIDSLDDPRIAPYRNLKDRDIARDGDRFIAEGEHVVRRLLASDFLVESVLLASRRVARMTAAVGARAPIYVVSDEMMRHVVGYKFHSGVIACGHRKSAQTLEQAMQSLPSRATVVICPELANTENLGGLMRIAAGFGVDVFILGPGSCDPFYRQAVRVSMGAAFSLNLYQSNDLIRDLTELRQRWGVELLATVLDESAEPLQQSHRGERTALLFGNEAQGLSAEIVAACDRKITIPMKLGTDSFNVAVAAAICLYHFTSEAR